MNAETKQENMTAFVWHWMRVMTQAILLRYCHSSHNVIVWRRYALECVLNLEGTCGALDRTNGGMTTGVGLMGPTGRQMDIQNSVSYMEIHHPRTVTFLEKC
jgi:hypothetical protein